MSEDKDELVDFQVRDRRFWVSESQADAAPRKEKLPTFVEELKARTERAEKKLDDRLDEIDAENEAYRSRLSREMDKRLLQEKERILVRFLEVIDNFERAIEAARSGSEFDVLREGVELNLELFMNHLRSEGIEQLDVLNNDFNPHDAEAIGFSEVQDPQLDQKVVEVLQPGYRLGETLLRPARVRVGKFSG